MGFKKEVYEVELLGLDPTRPHTAEDLRGHQPVLGAVDQTRMEKAVSKEVHIPAPTPTVVQETQQPVVQDQAMLEPEVAVLGEMLETIEPDRVIERVGLEERAEDVKLALKELHTPPQEEEVPQVKEADEPLRAAPATRKPKVKKRTPTKKTRSLPTADKGALKETT
jgi:hypothetical protein